MTELSGLGTTHALHAPGPLGSIGVPLPGVEAKVADLGDPARDAPAGAPGELWVRGPVMMLGYYANPQATAEALTADGWLRTGDVARRDSRGYLYVVDRLKDMIITGGRNVYSVEVEGALAAHPDIVDCAVVARPHPDYGESIVAVVTPREGAEITLDDVRAFCAGRIADYKIPHDILIGPVPRNPSGKILKHRLRDVVLAEPVA